MPIKISDDSSVRLLGSGVFYSGWNPGAVQVTIAGVSMTGDEVNALSELAKAENDGVIDIDFLEVNLARVRKKPAEAG